MEGLYSRISAHYAANRRKYLLVARQSLVPVMRAAVQQLRGGFVDSVLSHPCTALRDFKSFLSRAPLLHVCAAVQDVPFCASPAQVLFGADFPHFLFQNVAEGFVFVLIIIYADERLRDAFQRAFPRDTAFSARLTFTQPGITDDALLHAREKALQRGKNTPNGAQMQLELLFEHAARESSMLRPDGGYNEQSKGFLTQNAESSKIVVAIENSGQDTQAQQIKPVFKCPRHPDIPQPEATRQKPHNPVKGVFQGECNEYAAVGLPELIRVLRIASARVNGVPVSIVLFANRMRAVYDCTTFQPLTNVPATPHWQERFLQRGAACFDAKIECAHKDIFFNDEDAKQVKHAEVQRFWRLRPRQLVVVFDDFTEISVEEGRLACVRRLSAAERSQIEAMLRDQ